MPTWFNRFVDAGGPQPVLGPKISKPIKGWTQTEPSCSRFYATEPTPEMVTIEDIARHLSNQCRFNGAVKRHYSVAEHSINVALRVPKEHQLQALLHDASEAYMGDCVTPVKRQDFMAGFRDVDDRIQRMIYRKFGCPEDMHASVHEADQRMLATEAHQLKTRVDPEWAAMLAPRYVMRIPAKMPDPDHIMDSFLGWFDAFRNGLHGVP